MDKKTEEDGEKILLAAVGFLVKAFVVLHI